MINKIVHINGLVDENDIKTALRTHGDDVVAGLPCPITDYNYETQEGKINPHATRFTLKNGQYFSVFHVKPIYYETLEGLWRPLSEVTNGFGNTWIDFKADWHTKMHPRYMGWLIKRAEILKKKSGLTIPSPYHTVTVEKTEVLFQ
jgi:hypothetical protein